MKLKTYALEWEATIRGTQLVEAFDEEDAREQFDQTKYDSDIPDEPIHASLEEVRLLVEKKKRK